MYEVIVILKALTEVAGIAMIGQGVLYVLAGAKRDQNLVYGIFKTLTSPVMKVTRWITPRVVLDQHVGLVAFLLLFMLWLGLTAMKIRIVLENAPSAKAALASRSAGVDEAPFVVALATAHPRGRD